MKSNGHTRWLDSTQTTIRRFCYEVEAEVDGEFRRVGDARDWQQVLDRASSIRRLGPGLYQVDGPEGVRTYLVDGGL